MAIGDYIYTILKMRAQGHSNADIHRQIVKEGCTCSYKSLCRYVAKFKSVEVPKARIPYTPRSLADNVQIIEAAIHKHYASDSSASAAVVAADLRERGVSVSLTHLRRTRARLGYLRTSTKYCHMIRGPNKEKRVDFCSLMLGNGETFTDCVFTDECTIQIDCSVRHCYAKKGDHFSRFRSRAKHPAKIHLWGGISTRGRTNLAIFAGEIRMDSKFYCEILEKTLVCFTDQVYKGQARLVQDNAPAHKSAYTTKWLEDHEIQVLEWPPESPDLNPVELVWGNMKTYIRKQKVHTVQDLKKAANDYWNSITPETCARYVEGVQWRMKRVIEEGGKNIVENK